ncbi:MAG: VOC family protein [Armatimonadota bacterium]|jgi:hypothetical protein
MVHPVIHFEIPATDVEKLKRFYSDLFGWTMQSMTFPEFWMVTTAAEGHGINGAIMKRQAAQQTHLNYVSIESVEAFSAKVSQLGGQVVVPKTAVPKMGYFAVCLDPEGNPIGLWEMDPSAA